MRDLSDEFKLSVRSIGPVFEALGTMVSRGVSDRTIRFGGGRKPTRAAVVSGLILWAGAQPPEEQKRLMREALALLDQELAREDEAAAPPPPRDYQDVSGGIRVKGKGKGRRKA